MKFQIVVMAGKDKVHESIATERDLSDDVAQAHRSACKHYRCNDGTMETDTPVITVTVTPIAEGKSA